MKKVRLYLFYFFVFCFLGWLWEVIYNYIRLGIFINAGTLIGPWLPIYGWSGILIVIISEKIKNKPLTLYLVSFILFGIIEYATSVYLEMFHHLKWWDYSKYFLNINGRVWIIGLSVFALFGYLIVYLLIPLLNKIYIKIDKKTLTYVLIILLRLHVFDYIYSTINVNDQNAKTIKSVNIGM